MMRLAGVVLAAGVGKRMNSSLPKVIHRIQGVPMIQYVLDTLHGLKAGNITVVVGKHIAQIRKSVKDAAALSFVYQKAPKGTAHALLQAAPVLSGFRGTVIVVNGDTPLVTRETLRKFLLLHKRRKNKISILSFISQDPASYGRIVRDKTRTLAGIVEEGDATPSQKIIREVNSGIYAFEPGILGLLKKIKINKAKGEYYLTDIIAAARRSGTKMEAFCVGTEEELMGVNTRAELEKARKLVKDRILRKWLKNGVIFVDENFVFLSPNITIGENTVVYPNVCIEGTTRIGGNCMIYPNVRIMDSVVGDGAIIKDSTVIEESVIENGATVGPFARVRPGSRVGEGARIGNFVELKKVAIGAGTKASHLSYLGDAKIGKDVNIGAGTITCNYDGYRKNVTTIGDNVFIGSDSQLIAPVTIGNGAYVGAGATITRDVPPKALALSRVEQKNIEGWATRRELKVKEAKSKAKNVKRKA
jgi:bifunctional UDP-N-acetylglucosamine pyrophosphorylase/glucosamine-1-phosphate N-acetyltransferase